MSRVVGATRCEGCPIGRYQPQSGNSDCEDCAAGYFAPSSAATFCDKCSNTKGPAFTSTERSSNCSKCIHGYYMSEQDTCEVCPTGAACAQGTSVYGLEIEPGYYRFSSTSTNVYECPNQPDCVGGNATGSDLCSEGADGPLCFSCTQV